MSPFVNHPNLPYMCTQLVPKALKFRSYQTPLLTSSWNMKVRTFNAIPQLCIEALMMYKYYCAYYMGIQFTVETCGLVDSALDALSKGLGYNAHFLLCVEVLFKLLIPCCCCLHTSDICLLDTNCH